LKLEAPVSCAGIWGIWSLATIPCTSSSVRTLCCLFGGWFPAKIKEVLDFNILMTATLRTFPASAFKVVFFFSLFFFSTGLLILLADQLCDPTR
jgi:hypothetical protein